MISSGSVHNDQASFANCLNQYSSKITELSSAWKGPSYDNIVAKTEAFLESSLSLIKGQMDAFSSACDLYQEYVTCKSNLSVAESNYNQALYREDKSAASQYSSEIASYQSKLTELKKQTESTLASISEKIEVSSLSTATDLKTGTSEFSQGELTDEQIAEMIEYGRSQIGSKYNSMNYGPKNEDGSNGTGFGCAMFVSYCYNNVLFNGASGAEKGLGGFYGSCKNFWGNVTTDNFDAYNKGFVEVSAEEAKSGDIVCFVVKGEDGYHSSAENCFHVGLYEGDGKMIHSSRYVTSGVGECKIEDYLAVRGKKCETFYLHYVNNDTTTEDENE